MNNRKRRSPPGRVASRRSKLARSSRALAKTGERSISPRPQGVSRLAMDIGALSYLEDPLKRDFYAELCRVERWSTRMPPHQVLRSRFQRALAAARAQMASQVAETA